MASGSTVSGDPQATSRAKQHEIPSDYIEGQLEKTSGEVRLIEISISILTLSIATLIYLLLLGIVEHWFITGGLSTFTRTLLLIGLMIGLIVYARRRLFPYLRYKISLAYAAHTIEQSEPRLKNSLLNFLFLRQQRKGVSGTVLRGLEQQAATGLSRVSTDLSIERKRLIHLGIAIIAIILFGAIYTVFSPKSLLPEVGRMLLPWADINAATRVTIENVEPGNKKVTLRSKVHVSAEVKGLRAGEQVSLVCSSVGGGAIDHRIPMHAGSGTNNYSGQVTESEAGVVTDLIYRIEAGDAISKEYQLQVIPAPSFQVKSVRYQYPPYTGLKSRSVKSVGDLRAIEGTRVDITAQSTDEIAVATLHLDGERDSQRDRAIRMEVEGNRARCQFMLRRKPVAGDSVPEYSTYQLSLKTPSGKVNQNEVRHQISILRDQPPVVEILEPKDSMIEVREDAALSFEVRGRDPDFRLTELWLVGHQGQIERFKMDLLGRSKRTGEPLRAVHRESPQFVPKDWGLRAGDTVSVFAVAFDNKQPDANRSETPSLQVRILPPLPGGQQEKSSPSGDQSGESLTEEDQADNADDQSENKGTEESEGGGQEGGEGQGSESGSRQADGTEQAQGEQNQPNGQSGAGQSNQQDKSAGDAEEGGSGQSSTAQDAGKEGTQEGSNSQGQSTSSSGREDGKSSSADPKDTSSKASENQGSSTEQSATDQAPSNSSNGAQQSNDADQQSNQEEQSGDQSASAGGNNPKVDNDGDAFDQLSEHIKEKSSRGGQSSSNDSAVSSSSQEPSSSAENNHKKSTEEKSTEDSPSAGPQGSAQSPSQQNPEQAQPEQDAGQTGRGGSKQNSEQKREGAGERDRIGEAKENTPSDNERSSDASAEASRDETGGGTGNAGEQPPPPGEGLGQDRRKSGSTQQDSQQDEEPSDGGVSKRDSDSAQGQEGSRHGKGQEGGGQQSQQEGEGAAGANTPSDAGKGSSSEPGQGVSGASEGNTAEGQQPTGKAGTQAGQGSSQGPSDSDSKKNGKGGSSASASSSQQPGGDTPPSEEGEGGGGIGSSKTEQLDSLNEPGADKANLDYANQTTDMVLEYLENQIDRGGIDADLKKQFGWTDQDFADFVRRYRNLKKNAQLQGKAGERAKNKWNAVLRSLGLTPPQTAARTSSLQADRTNGLQESGRSLPPQEDQNRFDAFRKDVLGR